MDWCVNIMHIWQVWRVCNLINHDLIIWEDLILILDSSYSLMKNMAFVLNTAVCQLCMNLPCALPLWAWPSIVTSSAIAVTFDWFLFYFPPYQSLGKGLFFSCHFISLYHFLMDTSLNVLLYAFKMLLLLLFSLGNCLYPWRSFVQAFLGSYIKTCLPCVA